MANLRSLHAAANSYVMDNKQWPQIPYAKPGDPQYTKSWIEALEPYGITHKNWICPTIQKLLKSPDYTKTPDLRIDYAATPFDEHYQTPYKWATQPWFVEKADVHGNGNLMIYRDGTIEELKNVRLMSN